MSRVIKTEPAMRRVIIKTVAQRKCDCCREKRDFDYGEFLVVERVHKSLLGTQTLKVTPVWWCHNCVNLQKAREEGRPIIHTGW